MQLKNKIQRPIRNHLQIGALFPELKRNRLECANNFTSRVPYCFVKCGIHNTEFVSCTLLSVKSQFLKSLNLASGQADQLNVQILNEIICRARIEFLKNINHFVSVRAIPIENLLWRYSNLKDWRFDTHDFLNDIRHNLDLYPDSFKSICGSYTRGLKLHHLKLRPDNKISNNSSYPTAQSANPLSGAGDRRFGGASCCFEFAEAHVAIQPIADEQHQDERHASAKAEGVYVGGFEHRLAASFCRLSCGADRTFKHGYGDAIIIVSNVSRFEHGFKDYPLLICCQFVVGINVRINFRQGCTVVCIIPNVEALNENSAEVLEYPHKEQRRNSNKHQTCPWGVFEHHRVMLQRSGEDFLAAITFGEKQKSIFGFSKGSFCLFDLRSEFFRRPRYVGQFPELIASSDDFVQWRLCQAGQKFTDASPIPQKHDWNDDEGRKSDQSHECIVSCVSLPALVCWAKLQFVFSTLNCCNSSNSCFGQICIIINVRLVSVKIVRSQFNGHLSDQCGNFASANFSELLPQSRLCHFDSIYRRMGPPSMLARFAEVYSRQISHGNQTFNRWNALVKNVVSNQSVWQYNAVIFYNLGEASASFRSRVLLELQSSFVDKICCVVNKLAPLAIICKAFQTCCSIGETFKPIQKLFSTRKLLVKWPSCNFKESWKLGSFLPISDRCWRLKVWKALNIFCSLALLYKTYKYVTCEAQYSIIHFGDEGDYLGVEAHSANFRGKRKSNLYNYKLLYLASLDLTILSKQSMIQGEASEPLLLADTAPESQRYFCVRNPENGRIACALAYGREGGEYNTRKGNKPACLAQVLNLPLTSGSSEAFWEWCLNAMLEAFMMTCHSSRQRRACALSHSLDQIDLALEAERTLIDAMLFVANETPFTGRESQMLHGLLYLLSEHQAKTEQAASEAHRALREQRAARASA